MNYYANKKKTIIEKA